MTDWLLGAVDQYGWDQVRPWVKSIRASGFTGRVTLLIYRGDATEMQRQCNTYDIEVLHAFADSWSQPISHTARMRDTQSHQMRFFHFWCLLNANNIGKYEHVILTDVRDVIFQSDPSAWLASGPLEHEDIVAPSEGLLYRDEPWGADNLQRGFGPLVWQFMQDQPIANVGTIAGLAGPIRDLCLTLYLMGENRYIPNDQSGFNVLIRTMLARMTEFVRMGWGWAAQCGTMLDPQKVPTFYTKWLELPPLIEDGMVLTPSKTPFALVHQWDRVPELKNAVEARYA